MSKPSKLLKVVAILVIIFSAIGLLGNLALAGSADSIAQLYGTMGLQAPGTSFYVVAILVGLISLIAGIVGVMHKSKQSVLIFGVLYLIGRDHKHHLFLCIGGRFRCYFCHWVGTSHPLPLGMVSFRVNQGFFGLPYGSSFFLQIFTFSTIIEYHYGIRRELS